MVQVSIALLDKCSRDLPMRQLVILIGSNRGVLRRWLARKHDFDVIIVQVMNRLRLLLWWRRQLVCGCTAFIRDDSIATCDIITTARVRTLHACVLRRGTGPINSRFMPS